jgi:hypothetical protein
MRALAVPVGLAVLHLAAPLRAQVNVEPIRERLKQRGRTLELKANLAERTGNSDQIELGSGVLFGLSGEQNLFYVSGSAAYSRVDHETNVSNAFLHVRYNRALVPRVAWELFTQLESDRFRRVSFRWLAGTGPRFDVVDQAELKLFYGLSYMLEITKRNAEVPPADRQHTRHRMNDYATVNYTPDPRVALSETIYYQPRFDDFSDFWLLSVFAARFQVTSVLSTQLDFNLHRESLVPPGVKSTDTELLSSLVFSL